MARSDPLHHSGDGVGQRRWRGARNSLRRVNVDGHRSDRWRLLPHGVRRAAQRSGDESSAAATSCITTSTAEVGSPTVAVAFLRADLMRFSDEAPPNPQLARGGWRTADQAPPNPQLARGGAQVPGVLTVIAPSNAGRARSRSRGEQHVPYPWAMYLELEELLLSSTDS